MWPPPFGKTELYWCEVSARYTRQTMIIALTFVPKAMVSFDAENVQKPNCKHVCPYFIHSYQIHTQTVIYFGKFGEVLFVTAITVVQAFENCFLVVHMKR